MARNWLPSFVKLWNGALERAPSYSPTRGMDHSIRVFRNAQRLCSMFTVEEEPVLAAAFFHDIASHFHSKDHAKDSAFMAEELLKKINFPGNFIPLVKKCIASHETYGGQDVLESRILFDANIMDKFGPEGISRIILYNSERNVPLQQIAENALLHTSRALEFLNLPESRSLMRDDVSYTVEFFQRLKEKTQFL